MIIKFNIFPTFYKKKSFWNHIIFLNQIRKKVEKVDFRLF
jgi:hypothetical protein